MTTTHDPDPGTAAPGPLDRLLGVFSDVRSGDLVSTAVVFVGTSWLALEVRGFAVLNIGIVLVWLVVATVLVRENRRLSAAAQPLA